MFGQRITNFQCCIYFAEEPDDSSKDAKEKAKPVKCKAKLISPQLLACKIEMNKVELPPALRQRAIQLQALESNRLSGELLLPQSIKIQSVENELRQRKKAVVVENINHHKSDHTSSSSTDDDEYGPDDKGTFETHLVIEFSPDIQKKTLHWLIDRIRTKVSRGGAGLDVRREPQTE